MKKKRLLSSELSGIAGEYLVAGELSRRGYVASITLRKNKGIDILASNEKGSKAIAIQVKTNQDHNKYWILNKKAEENYNDNLFYVFVNLNKGREAKFFIVPSKIVAKFITNFHKEHLVKRGQYGRKHKDSPMRKFVDSEKKYLNRWDLLGL